MNKKLFRFSVGGFFFVSIVGTLMHFVYDWSGQNPLVALVAAVNESTWEHMKLIFFPMIVFEIYQYAKLKEEYPVILYGGLYATIIGTFSIPILFYGYQMLFGKDNFIINILIFLISVLVGMILNYLLANACKNEACQTIALVIGTILMAGFFIFTFMPPEGVIFEEPTL